MNLCFATSSLGSMADEIDKVAALGTSNDFVSVL